MAFWGVMLLSSTSPAEIVFALWCGVKTQRFVTWMWNST